jgi:LSD1 subclass zinc finger protein
MDKKEVKENPYDIKPEQLKAISGELKCKSCSAVLKFAPGTNSLKCQYCGSENEIKAEKAEAIQELDFQQAITEGLKTQEEQKVSTVKCGGCGATSTLKPNKTSDQCPFCGTSLVLTSSAITTSIKPKSVLPFKIDKNKAFDSFSKWVKSLWWAPSNLKKAALNVDKLNGIYIPYWTYDCGTRTSYSGERGIHRQETEYYTEEVNGRSVQRSRTVTVTDWYYCSGNVSVNFDDVLVNASNSLPKDYADKLEPWDLKNLVPFDEKYLAGFQAESYQLGLKEGFDVAKKIMDGPIQNAIRRDIGGDDQRINSYNTQYNRITFKHTLLPIWISAYRYGSKVYRFMVNGSTGEVQGERPYSAVKIFFAIVAGLIAAWILYAMFAQ